MLRGFFKRLKPGDSLVDGPEYPWEHTERKNVRILLLQVALVVVSIGVGYCLHWAIGG